jgi:zinc-ribbon domain
MKSITGQYECVHHSGLGFDYFTSRIDRLTIQANGQFIFVVQERSRISHSARSLMSGQQIDTNAPEILRVGKYSNQGNDIIFYFDDGTRDQGQLTANGIQLGKNFFEKVSDSTLLPPTHRMKSNLEDISKGLKIAGAIGGAAIKAAKTIQDTIQTAQGAQSTPASDASPKGVNSQTQRNQVTQTPPVSTPVSATTPAQSTNEAIPGQHIETLFCDQCGAPVRPGKRFCNHCGARLP